MTTPTPIALNTDECPAELRPLLSGAVCYDRSSSPGARVVFIDKGGGYFLKSAPKRGLEREAAMTRYFHGKGLAANVLAYISSERDWMLTEKIRGSGAEAVERLEHPWRLCDALAERLAALHSEDYADCPVQNHTGSYLAGAERNKRAGVFDERRFHGGCGLRNAEEAWAVVESCGHLLKTDTLLHGDYCLPNIILDGWRFSGFVDLGCGGVGDRHVDVFWGLWSLRFNLKTDKCRERFMDVYGRGKIDGEMLRIVAAAEVFG